MNNNFWHKLTCALVIIGGINWGLVALSYFFKTQLNIVTLIFTTWLNVPVLEAIIYLLVGIAAVMHAFTCWKQTD
jgi:uncharacterized membrane protein YuzA (DUF378 family)